jgi:2-polyprenyl-6-methoxyphenol hydroxylase-like FAD-dependent oxidoreductase
MSVPTASPRIAIIGAGPAGLCLAAILQRNGIACEIFEGEDSTVARDQGGTLDLHPGSGQAALEAAGLLDDFHKHARPEGEATKLVLANGEILWDDNIATMSQASLERGRPEIDRTVLRELLLSAVSPGSIHWSAKIARVVSNQPSAGTATLELSTGGSAGPYDLIVGADGAWSRARSVLTDVKPTYSGITAVELWAHNTADHHPWLHAYAGAGSMYMFDDGRAIISQRQGSGDVRVYAAVRVPEGWKEESGIDWNSKSARDMLIDNQFPDVAEDLKRLIREANDKMVVRSLYQLPVDHEWTAHPQVTVLGDAAHLMTPFAGVGVNMALADAKDLADEVLKACGTGVAGETQKNDAAPTPVPASAPSGTTAATTSATTSPAPRVVQAIAAYEAKMYPRAHGAAKKTAHGLLMHFSKDGGPERAEKLKRHAKMREEMAKSGKGGKVEGLQ